MSKRETGRDVLISAENRLRELLAAAAADGDYEDVSELTQWAKSIQSIVRESTRPEKETATKNGERQTLTLKAKRSSSTTGKARSAYPKFYRDGDSLVKVAWSKASKSEYEHKAPRAVVSQLAAMMNRPNGKSDLISMEQVLPLIDSDGAEVPSYQSYLCLAWLREVGLVRQHGRQGYSLRPSARFEHDLRLAWESLPTRSPE